MHARAHKHMCTAGTYKVEIAIGYIIYDDPSSRIWIEYVRGSMCECECVVRLY